MTSNISRGIFIHLISPLNHIIFYQSKTILKTNTEFSLFLSKAGKIRLFISIWPILFSLQYQRSKALEKQISHNSYTNIYQHPPKLFGHFDSTSERRNNLGGCWWPRGDSKVNFTRSLGPSRRRQ